MDILNILDLTTAQLQWYSDRDISAQAYPGNSDVPACFSRNPPLPEPREPPSRLPSLSTCLSLSPRRSRVFRRRKGVQRVISPAHRYCVPQRNPFGFFFDSSHSPLATAARSISKCHPSSNLQIPLSTNPLFSHLYKTPGVPHPSSLISSVPPCTSRVSRATTHFFSSASALFVTTLRRLSFLFNSLRTLLRNTGGWPCNARPAT